MGIIERHQGCPEQVGPKWDGCYGPRGTYYTVFGSELRHLISHMAISALLGLVLFGVLYILHKKEKIKLPLYLIILIPILFAIILFFVLAYFFPVRVMY